MKYFQPLVLERKVKIPAPVWEMVAHAAAAPFLPPCMSMVLHRKFDCESRCFAPKVLSDTSYFVACSHIFRYRVPQISATLLVSADQVTHVIGNKTNARSPLHRVVGPVDIIQKTGLAYQHTSRCLAYGEIMISYLGDKD